MDNTFGAVTVEIKTGGLTLGDDGWPDADPAFLYIFAPPVHSCSLTFERDLVLLKYYL